MTIMMKACYKYSTSQFRAMIQLHTQAT